MIRESLTSILSPRGLVVVGLILCGGALLLWSRTQAEWYEHYVARSLWADIVDEHNLSSAQPVADISQMQIEDVLAVGMRVVPRNQSLGTRASRMAWLAFLAKVGWLGCWTGALLAVSRPTRRTSPMFGSPGRRLRGRLTTSATGF